MAGAVMDTVDPPRVDDFDLLSVPLCVHAFELLLGQDPLACDDATDAAARNCVEMMASTTVPFRCFSEVVQYLARRGIACSLDEAWRVSESLRSTALSASYSLRLERFAAAHAHTAHDRQDVLTRLRREIVVCFANGHFTRAQNCIDTYASVVQFSSKPATVADLDANAYCQFSFLALVVALYNYIMAPLQNDDAMDSDDAVPDPADTALKSIEAIYAKSETYLAKNDRLFMENSSETHYCRLLRLVHTLVLFRTLRIQDYSDTFSALLLSDKPETASYQSILDMPGANHLRSLLLALFGVSQLFTRPFNQLSFHDYPHADWLADQLTLDPSSVESVMYTDLLLPLARGDNAHARAALHSGSPLYRMVHACALHFFPQQPRPEQAMAFWSYAVRVLTFKMFLVVISISGKIPLSTLLRLMGYPADLGPDAKARVLDSLLQLVSALGLGNQGVHYSVRDQMFSFAEETAGTGGVELRRSIHELAGQVRGNALATLVHATLLDKFGL